GVVSEGVVLRTRREGVRGGGGRPGGGAGGAGGGGGGARRERARRERLRGPHGRDQKHEREEGRPHRVTLPAHSALSSKVFVSARHHSSVPSIVPAPHRGPLRRTAPSRPLPGATRVAWSAHPREREV